MVRGIQGMDILEIEEALREGCLSTQCALVVRAGNILCEFKGKNYKAEMLLRGFLVGDFADKKNCIILSAAGSSADKGEREASREIVENCFVFLALCIGMVQMETVYILDEIGKNPPYPEFTRAIQDKLRANRIAA